MVREERLVETFLWLLAFDAPPKKEGVMVGAVRDRLEAEGFDVEEDEAAARIGGQANNLIVRLRATAPGPRVFLSAHFDTVESTESLTVEEVDGVFRPASDTILGADCRCGLAASIEAMRALRESGESHGEVVGLFTVAEEIGLLGASALDLKDLNLDYGFVLDTGPPVGSFVTRAATHDELRVQIVGKPAHAGKEPEEGISAIQVGAEAIHGMRLGRIGPETTANLGTIEGGTAANVVPALVTIRGEARSTDEAALEAQIDHMVQRFEETASRHGARVEIEHHRHYHGYVVPDDAAPVRVADAGARSIGLTPTRRTTLGGSDGNVFNAKGVACVVLGTGMDRIHTHQEQITRRDLVLSAEMALACLRQAQRHGIEG